MIEEYFNNLFEFGNWQIIFIWVSIVVGLGLILAEIRGTKEREERKKQNRWMNDRDFDGKRGKAIAQIMFWTVLIMLVLLALFLAIDLIAFLFGLLVGYLSG